MKPPVGRKALWRLMVFGPVVFLGFTVVLQVLEQDWLDALTYAAGLVAMFFSLSQLRQHFRMGYSRGYLDRMDDEAKPPADRRPPGRYPEPWDVMYGPEPRIPGPPYRGLDVQD